MKIINEISLESFDAWSGAVNTLDRIRDAGLCNTLENILEDMYPDGMTDTELNDLLWFEPDTVYEWLGMRTESAIREELEEAEEELAELMQNYEDECESIDEWADEEEQDEVDAEYRKAELWRTDYKADADDLEERIAELQEELADI